MATFSCYVSQKLPHFWSFRIRGIGGIPHLLLQCDTPPGNFCWRRLGWPTARFHLLSESKRHIEWTGWTGQYYIYTHIYIYIHIYNILYHIIICECWQCLAEVMILILSLQHIRFSSFWPAVLQMACECLRRLLKPIKSMARFHTTVKCGLILYVIYYN